MYKNYLYAYLKHTSLMLELSLTVNLPDPNTPKSKEKNQSSISSFVTSEAPFLTLYQLGLDKKEAGHLQHPSTDSEDGGVPWT